jgi:hypothetical protein
VSSFTINESEKAQNGFEIPPGTMGCKIRHGGQGSMTKSPVRRPGLSAGIFAHHDDLRPFI